MYFGKASDGVWCFDVSQTTFENCIEVDDETHIKIITEANDTDKIIIGDEKGYPILVDAPKPSEKQLAKARIKELKRYLDSTDWYVTRFAETGKEIPVEVKKQRQDARDEISRLKG